MPQFLLDPNGQVAWISIAIYAFAVAFFCVGVWRTVEFAGIGLSSGKRVLFSILHVIGTALFSTAIVIGGLDVAKYRTAMYVCFIVALVFLAPGQFTIGMKRRKDQ